MTADRCDGECHEADGDAEAAGCDQHRLDEVDLMNTKKKGAGSSPTRRASKPSHMAEREAAFRIYRDMGVGRTYEKLRVAFAKGHVAVTTRTLANWAKAHDWRKRVDDHDIAIS
jgi:hypothetical protein